MLAEGLKTPRLRGARSPADLSRRLLSLAEEVSEDEMSEDGERENENHVLVGERRPGTWSCPVSGSSWRLRLPPDAPLAQAADAPRDPVPRAPWGASIPYWGLC